MVACEGTYGALPYGGAVAPRRCLRAGRSRNWGAGVALRRLASPMPRADRVDIPFGTVARVAVCPSWRCWAVSSFAASRGPLVHHR